MITVGRLLHSARKRFRDVQYKIWDIQGAIRNNGMPAYWWNGSFNFGDLITPLLLRHYGFTPVFSRPPKARLAAAGSVLDEFPDEYNGVILGSGFIRRNSAQTFPRAAVLAVRGELTRKKLRRGHEVELGDPGLLASLVMAERRPKQYALGVIPHYLDRENENFVSLKKNISGNARFIDVRQNPRAVFDAIDQCEKIVSSSLHGLIVSDSLGIPNAWVESKNLPDGRFKFDDYYSAMGLRENPLSLKGDEPLDVLLESCSLKPQDKIIKIKNTLDGLWRALRDIPFR